MDLSKKFSETRKIENFMFKLSPKEKYVLHEYCREMGISNASEWVRKIVFNHIDAGIKQNNLLSS